MKRNTTATITFTANINAIVAVKVIVASLNLGATQNLTTFRRYECYKFKHKKSVSPHSLETERQRTTRVP